MCCHIGQSIGQGLLDVLCNVVCLLRSTADADTVVGTISLHEVGCLCCEIELLLQILGVLESVKLEGAWVLLLLVELFTEELWQHLVHSNV